MNKLLASILLFTQVGYAQFSVHNLQDYIKELRLKTHRCEFVDTPYILEAIIQELYNIQHELQEVSLITHQALQNMHENAEMLTEISTQLSNIVPEHYFDVSMKNKLKGPRKNTNLSRTLKVLEKNHKALTKHMRDFTTVNTILVATLQELESIQEEIYILAYTISNLSQCYHSQAKNLFAIALRLFTLTGLESDTGPYLCETAGIVPTDGFEVE